MKCIGMLLIVYGHVATAWPLNSIPPINTKQLGVAFFLFVTGFSLARETRERWHVVFNRLFEIYLLGLAIAVVVSIVAYATSATVNKSNYLPFFFGVNVIFNFFPANPTTWYVGTYCHVLLIWALFLHRCRIRPWMLAVSFAVEILVRAALMGATRDLIAYMLVSNWASVFLLGMLQGQRATTDERRGLAGYLAALAVLMVGWGLASRSLSMNGTFPFMRFAGAQTSPKLLLTSACISVVYLSFTWLTFEITRRVEDRPIVRFMARNTLFVFIAHMPVYYGLLWLLRGWNVSYWIRAGLRLVVCFLVLAVVSEILTRIVKPRELRARVWDRLTLLLKPAWA